MPAPHLVHHGTLGMELGPVLNGRGFHGHEIAPIADGIPKFRMPGDLVLSHHVHALPVRERLAHHAERPDVDRWENVDVVRNS